MLVLGGGGFLAGHIERHYRQLGWRVVSVGRGAASAEGDVRHVWSLPHPEFAHLLAVEQPHVCVNAAGRASVPTSLIEPFADFEASTLLNYRILEDLRRISPRTIYIHLSSAAVYGNPVHLPISEESDVAPISPYGWHKRMSEIVLHQYAQFFGLRTASLRIFSAYGAGLKRQVVWDLCRRALTTAEGALMIQGNPEDSRDFIHGSDVARAIQAVAECGMLSGECYNVAAGVETPIKTLAKLVMCLAGRGLPIAFDHLRGPGNPGRWHAHIGRLCGLGFHPRVALEEGVNEVLACAGDRRSARSE